MSSMQDAIARADEIGLRLLSRRDEARGFTLGDAEILIDARTSRRVSMMVVRIGVVRPRHGGARTRYLIVQVRRRTAGGPPHISAMRVTPEHVAAIAPALAAVEGVRG